VPGATTGSNGALIRGLRVAALALALCILFSFTAFAGEWKNDPNGWWYDNGDNTYMANGWFQDVERDGAWYYFDSRGYIIVNALTPDGYYVDANGRWTQSASQFALPTGTDATSVVNDASVAMIQGIIDAVNAERAVVGLAALEKDERLMNFAAVRTQEITTSFSHVRPNGQKVTDAAEFDGFAVWGENIAKGQRTVAEVMEDWMASKGHRENILRASFTKIGVGFQSNHWVQLFAAD
jgi:uncharacterized protein YkwD